MIETRRDRPATAPSDDAELIARLMRGRFSCRSFRPDPVPDAVLLRILDTVRWSASWSNIQPWDDTIITKPETTARLSAALLADEDDHHSDLPYTTRYTGDYLARRREVGFGLYQALSIRREDHEARHRQHLENFRFFGAPHVALLSVPRELGPYGALDIGAFVASFLLASQANGVATVAQAALAQKSQVIRDFFDLPADRDFACGIAFGYADPSHPANKFRSSRAGIAELCRFV